MQRGDKTSEQLLLRRISREDDAAFWSVWQRHKQHLYEVSLRHLSGMHADADEAVSRSMLIARDRLPDYAATIVNLEAWLTRLACNVCLDMHRERRGARGAALSLDEVHPHEEPLARTLSPEDECLLSEVRESIAGAIASLPPRLRDVAMLRFFQEMSYQTIAERLSITPANARKRVQQARTVLRRVLMGPAEA